MALRWLPRRTCLQVPSPKPRSLPEEWCCHGLCLIFSRPLSSSLAPHWWGHTQENLDPRRQQLWPLQRALQVSGYHGDATGPSPGAPGFHPGRGWTTKTAPPLVYLYSFPRSPNIDVVPSAPRWAKDLEMIKKANQVLSGRTCVPQWRQTQTDKEMTSEHEVC